MIKIENVDVFGWEVAIRGMRNPMNSWNLSDSDYGCRQEGSCESCEFECGYPEYVIGENDLKLMKTLSKAGADHSKFLRMINVTLDLTLPLYVWKEFDTYKVGTVANSCSTMHKIHAKEFTLDDFSYEHLGVEEIVLLEYIIKYLNGQRKEFINTKDKDYWWHMIQLLPSSYNQKRTVQLNYQVLKNMYFARKAHKLDEWREFCMWAETLPYFKEICIEVEND